MAGEGEGLVEDEDATATSGVDAGGEGLENFANSPGGADDEGEEVVRAVREEGHEEDVGGVMMAMVGKGRGKGGV